jgi:hypothetical protein
LNIITGLFATGYTLIVAKSSMNKERALPEWSNWLDLFIKGLLSFVIGLIYILPVIIIALALGSTGLFLSLLTTQNIVATLLAVGPLVLILVVLSILIAYITPYAVISYVNQEDFMQAFKLGEILQRTFTKIYFKAWIVGILYSIVVGIITSILSGLTLFTFIVPLILVGYYRIIVGITMMTLLGEAFRELK